MSDAWSIAKAGYGWLAGDGKHAGALGLGQYETDADKINKASFVDPDAEAHKAQVQSYMDSAGARTAPTSSAATLGPATTYGGAKATGATLDTSQEAAGRAYQQQLLAQLSEMSQGHGPSLAGQQLKQGLDMQLQQQAAAAGSMRPGMNAGLAMRNLGNQASTLGAQTNQQAANARIAEQMGALQQMGSASAAFRGQDQATAALQAQLAQSTNLANAGFQQQAGLANMGAVNDFAKTNAGFQQQSSLANQAAELQSRGLNDAQVRAMLAAKLGISESQLAAKMAYEQMNSNQQLGAAGIDSAAFAAASAARAKMISGIAQAAAASDERVKTDIEPGDKSVRNFLDSYGAAGKSSSPAEEKMNIGSGGGRIQAFLNALRSSPVNVQHAAQDNSDPWAGMGAAVDAGNAKDVAASAKESKDALDAKAASTDTAIAKSKLDDKATSVGAAMDRNPTADRFDPAKYAGNNGLDAGGYAMPAGGNAPPTPFVYGQPLSLAAPQAQAPVYADGGAADMAALNKIGAANPPAPSVYQGALGPGNADMNYLNALSAKYPPPQQIQELAPQYIASDEKVKRDVQPGFDDVERMMNDLKAHSYEYKSPEKPGRGEGEHFSPMAQEFGKSDVGRSMLTTLPDGTLGVDYGKSGGVTFAALADLHARLKKLEGGGDDKPKPKGKR